MANKKPCSLCGNGVASAVYDERHNDAQVRLCPRCLAMLRTHPEERAFLAIAHFGHPVRAEMPRRRAT